MSPRPAGPVVFRAETGPTLPRGATGFCRPKDGPLPETDVRTFRTALYAAARLARGTVGEVRERAYPLTFHSATVTGSTGEHVVLCHAHHPWIAFAPQRPHWSGEEFLAPPPWARPLRDAGFEVLSGEQLGTPLSVLDALALTEGEWRQVRHHGVTTVGGVLFNAWD
ncbi:hypothetical protein ACH4FX_13570 [Streptomyces sp. NPDC018019]|uniref:hypothetical protein n=1 Tax=Streptomyces sp. NPDC018019 TaxID=3365030 RepID=UPI0037BA139A